MAETPGKQEEAPTADPILNEMIAQAPFNELQWKMVAEGNKLLRDLIQKVAKSNGRLAYMIIYFRRIQDELNRQCRRLAELESEVTELRAHDHYPPTVDVPSRFLPLRALQLWHKAGSRYLIHRLGLWLAWKYR